MGVKTNYKTERRKWEWKQTIKQREGNGRGNKL